MTRRKASKKRSKDRQNDREEKGRDARSRISHFAKRIFFPFFFSHEKRDLFFEFPFPHEKNQKKMNFYLLKRAKSVIF